MDDQLVEVHSITAPRWILTAEQLAGFSHDERQLIGALLNRIDWLTHAIHDRAESGKPVSHYRFERKATSTYARSACAAVGLTAAARPGASG